MFYVLDAYALPVEGTETRVNAGADAVEYMVNFREMSEKIGKEENIVGWYHSHPGYGCWLSGIDVDTERLQQQVQDPYFAIVVDPQRSMSAGGLSLKGREDRHRVFPYIPEGQRGGQAEEEGGQRAQCASGEDRAVRVARERVLQDRPLILQVDAGLGPTAGDVEGVLDPDTGTLAFLERKMERQRRIRLTSLSRWWTFR